MKRKEILLIASAYALMLLCAGMLIYSRNYVAVLWIICAGIYLFYVIKARRINDDCIKSIKELQDYIDTNVQFVKDVTSYDTWNALIDAERESNLYKTNLERALKIMVKLKERNDLLTILNHNLIHHPSKKDYGKYTNRRADKSRTTFGDAE